MTTGIKALSATIANGASLSDAVDLLKHEVVGLVMPSAWTAASVTFQGSQDGSTYNDLYDSGGTEKSYTVAASRHVLLSAPEDFRGVRYLKVRSGTAGTPVNQGAERIIKVLIKDVL
jgi:hypothetical protein